MKKITTLVLSLMMILLMTSTAFAASLTSKDAVNKALKNAKLTKSKVAHLEYEYDSEDGVYEIEFTKKSNGAEYDYEIMKSSGKIVKKAVDFRYKHNSSESKITKTAARKKVAKFSGIPLSVIKKGTCRYHYSDHEGEYTIKFSYKGKAYEYELLAPTGKITDYEWEYIY